ESLRALRRAVLEPLRLVHDDGAQTDSDQLVLPVAHHGVTDEVHVGGGQGVGARATDDVDVDLRGELGELTGPVGHQRRGDHHDGGEGALDGEGGDCLNGLAEAHVVADDAAADLADEVDARPLEGEQLDAGGEHAGRVEV